MNVGTANIANVAIGLKFRLSDGANNGGVLATCGTLSPGETCWAAETTLASDFAMSCEITAPVVGKIRGTLCNVTWGMCSNAE